MAKVVEKKAKGLGCRDITQCFTNEQRVSHVIGENTWVGVYDSSKNGIVYNGQQLEQADTYTTAESFEITRFTVNFNTNFNF